MNICICDDNIIFCKKLAGILEDYSDMHKEIFHIHIVHSGESLYELLSNIYCELLFLDIELAGIDGIEAGHYIREHVKNQTTEIIYVSAKANYALELFVNRPFDFLVKPISQERVIRDIEKYMEVFHQKERFFLYEKKGCSRRQKLGDILYFESHLKKVKIVTLIGEDEFYGSLQEIYKKLGEEHFFFCHKSILVNYSNVKDFYYKKLVMIQGTEIPISQAKRPAVRNLSSKWRDF